MGDNKRRISARAIIIKDGKIYLMFRNKKEKGIFYSFAGGGLEQNETCSECVVREVKEEFGITVVPEKLVYIYCSKKSFELFYVCSYVSGELGTGNGEEFSTPNPDNVYIPKMVDISEIDNLPLKPPEIKKALIQDLKTGNLYKQGYFKEFLADNY